MKVQNLTEEKLRIMAENGIIEDAVFQVELRRIQKEREKKEKQVLMEKAFKVIESLEKQTLTILEEPENLKILKNKKVKIEITDEGKVFLSIVNNKKNGQGQKEYRSKKEGKEIIASSLSELAVKLGVPLPSYRCNIRQILEGKGFQVY